jgi:hypothetical protein
MAETMGERELRMRSSCLLAQLNPDADSSAAEATKCLEDALALASDLGGERDGFLARPDIARDIETAADVLSKTGREGELERFRQLRNEKGKES